jgi:hypothetical protein
MAQAAPVPAGDGASHGPGPVPSSEYDEREFYDRHVND